MCSYCGFLKFSPGQYRCKNSPEIYLDLGPQDNTYTVKNDKVHQDMKNRNFPGDPVVKTWPSNARAVGLIPDCKLISHMTHSQKTKT